MLKYYIILDACKHWSLIMKFKKWIFADVDKQYAAEVAEECDLDSLVVLIAMARGYTEPYEIDEFIEPGEDFSDPFDYKGICEASERINLALESNEKILVFGDYDCDGVTATALLTGYLQKRGASVSYKVPDREKDGYGISVDAVKEAADDGVTLIITVDNGINAVEEVKTAESLGIDVIITDHHIPQSEIPNAYAVVDPHLDDGDWVFNELCGVGVAFKLICAVEGRPCEEMIHEYGDLVALGTIADVVPLVGENRSIVSIGLSLINKKSNPGIRALIGAAGSKYLSSGGVSFTLCPRINAAGRMSSAEIAVKLLLSTDGADAEYYASLLDRLNTERQSTEQEIYEQATEIIEQNGYNNDNVIVVASRGWHRGVIGIVAAKVTEKYGKPSIVVDIDGDNSVGSGRSVDGFSLFDALTACKHDLVRFGGHNLAAGLTVREEDIDRFRTDICNFAANKEFSCPELRIDCRVKPRIFTVDAAKSIRVLEPYGSMNPTPVFAVTDCTLSSVYPLSGGKHIRLRLIKEQFEFTAVMFGCSPEDFPFTSGDCIDIAVNIDVSTYNGSESVSVIVRDVRPNGVDDEEMILQLAALRKLRSDDLDAASAGCLLPSRDDIAAVFKFIRLRGSVKIELVETALIRSVPVGKVNAAVICLSELGIIDFTDNVCSMKEFSGKADLDSAPLLKKLKSFIKE